ncbi:Zn(2)-C6 fungal-type domain-containing protein [Fusarium keratoplasticum]|nr:Zn(2)-C6 fungal-type domain-containing protein [Fusarium keratoplasticum]
MGAQDAKGNGQTRCDEQKPSCGRCTRAGVKCTGYGPQFRWSTKYEVFRQDAPKKPKRRETPKHQDQETSGPKSASENNRSLVPSPRLDLQEQNPTLSQTDERQDGLCEPLFESILLDLPGVTDLPDFFDENPPSDSLGTAFFLQGFGQSSLDLGQGEALIKDVPDVTNDQCIFYPATALPPSPSFPISPTSPQPHKAAIEESTQNPPLGTSVVSYSKASGHNMGTVSPARPLNDPASILVEFYFKETAQLFSCYDSSMNPFRTTVSRLWNSSPLLYKTLSSMAAASLVNDFPQLTALGKQLRKEAIEMLDKGSGPDQDLLLAMLMLGGSASWHNPRDLGLPFFNRARRKLASMSTVVSERHGVDYHFFHQSMTYWEMLLSYVAENDELDASIDEPTFSQGCTTLHFVPHPWTGFARDTQHAVQKVGRLIRKQRKMAFSHRFTSLSHIKQLEKDLAAASELEQYLCSLSHPVETTVLDTEDRNTPVWHLLTLAEAYRSTGLIQLYHIFPDLLDHRLVREGLLNPDLNDDQGPDSTSPSCQLRKDWLTSYAVQALNLMKSIPLESGTRDFQPFILVSLSSELRMSPPPVDTHDSGPGAYIADQMAGFTSKTIEVSRMRHFIKSRLNSFLHTLPPRPIHVCLDIVNETWRLMDERARLVSVTGSKSGSFESCEDVYWMDVMIQNRWETTMA